MSFHFLLCFCLPCQKLGDGNTKKENSRNSEEGKKKLLQSEEPALNDNQVTIFVGMQ